MAFAAGGLIFAALAVRLVPRLGERGLVLGGGLFMSAGYLGLAFAPGFALAVPCVVALGMGLYMMHNTLQMHATQMAPEARGGALALFAFCLFTGQSAGVWLASHAVDAAGTLPVFVVAAVGPAAARARFPAPAGDPSRGRLTRRWNCRPGGVFASCRPLYSRSGGSR